MLFAIVMVYDDADFVARSKWLQFSCQTGNKGCVIVYGNIWDYVDGNAMLVLEVVKAMNLHYLLVLGQCLSVTVVYSGSVGLKIFFTDSMSEVIPADSTNTAMMMALKYSTRPKPKGCSRSAGRSESFVPMIVMTLDSASLRLLTASITMATLLARMPTAALKAARSTLAIIPMILVRIISATTSL